MPAKKASNSVQITERVNSRGVSLAVDREAGTIRGVKILGLKSANGREYLPESLIKASALYEGKAVNVDHVDSNERRSYGDRIGRLTEIQVRADGLYGNLNFNPKHSLAEQLCWDAEHAPENVGLSHDATGKTSRRGKITIVEEITAVRSVDLVADPATTKGLFESLDLTEIEEDESVSTEINLKEATLDQLKAIQPTLVESIKAEVAESAEAKARAEELKTLREEVASLKADAAKHERRAKVLEDLKAAGFDTENRTHVSDLFMESLLREETVAKRTELIDDRKTLVGNAAKNQPSGGPQSTSRLFREGAGEYGDKPIERRVASWQE